MKTTGVTRKIDELGRIVIPKEIRKNLGIRDGENLEIFTDGDSIILKKYYEVKSLEELSSRLCKLVKSVYDFDVIITDREKVSTSSLKELIGFKLDDNLINLIDERKEFRGEGVFLGLSGYFEIVPIIASSDSLGLVIIISKSSNNYISLAKFLANILVEKIDI